MIARPTLAQPDDLSLPGRAFSSHRPLSSLPARVTGGMPWQPPPDPREESEAQRDDRNLAELLQELRVAGLGVQVLFGFLLSLPFTTKFSKVSQGQRDLYPGPCLPH
jgi:Family of unknown function (DUF6328)